MTFGQAILAPIICDFLRDHQEITISAVFLDRVTNLVDEGFDIAVRIGDLPESGLIARKVGRVRRLLVASPHISSNMVRPPAQAIWADTV